VLLGTAEHCLTNVTVSETAFILQIITATVGVLIFNVCSRKGLLGEDVKMCLQNFVCRINERKYPGGGEDANRVLKKIFRPERKEEM
jgi:hypothetical protein